MANNPYKSPATYSLEKDYARYGLNSGQAAKISGHRFTNRSGYKPLAIVLHIQEGNTSSSLSWWASGNADASSTVMIQRDGSLLKVIPQEHGPYTNGDVSRPTDKGRALLSRINNANPNLVTLSVEMEGKSADKATDAAIETVCWQITEWMNAYGLTTNDLYKHADFNSTSRAFCPGAYWDQVIARLNTTQPPKPNPTQWPNKPSWLQDEMILSLFPEADPGGTRTAAWLKYCGRVGRAPRRVAFHGTGANQLIEFADGALIDTSGKVLGNE